MKSQNTLGATLLVTGCCIGAGMIGLPVLSFFAGFMPSTLAMLFCYFFTTATGLLILESTLWFESKVSFPSIAEFALGRTGKALTGLLFLFLFYCIFVAYLDGGGHLFSNLLAYIFKRPVSRELGIFSCALLVSALTFAGTKMVDNLNRGLVVGMALSYGVLILIALPQIKTVNLQHSDWKAALATIPILMICFGYQNLVPSLTHYLKRNVPALRFAIIIGNLVPFFIYLLWNFIILGLLPASLAGQAQHEDMITDLLQEGSQYVSILFLVNAFSLFAIFTSFLPSAISCVDFLRDGLKYTGPSHSRQAIFLCGLVFVPPLLCTLFYPKLFLRALSFAGGFIDVLLFAVLPAVTVLIGRYFKQASGPYQVAGGRLTPIAVLLFSGVFLYLKCFA